MLTIDPRSIVLMANFISIFCLLVLLLMCRSFPKSIQGLKEWAWACAMAIVASALLFARGHISPLLSIVMGNVLIAAIFMLMYTSIRRFTGHKVHYRAMAVLLAVLIFLWTWAAYGDDYPHYGILLSSLSNTLLMAACTFAASQNHQRSTVKWFTLCSFGVATGVMALRFLTASMRLDVPNHLFDTSLVHKIYLTTYPLTFLATTFGYMLMTSDRLRDLLLDMNRTLEEAVAKRTADLQLEIQRTRKLEREIANIAEREQRRIGRELHDDLGQQLTGISLSAKALSQTLKQQSPSLVSLVDAMETASREAIAKVRQMAHGLMPVGPGSDGLREALTRLASNVSSVSPVACTFDYDEPVDVDDEHVAANLFRIAQEAVNNAIRHSRATQVLLRLDEEDGKVALSVEDNGVGIEVARSERLTEERGVGLRIMAFRASIIGFLLTIESQAGHGTTIRVMQC